jgi:hypothetical protein
MTDTLQKALAILTAQAANPIALEELVKAMETCLEGKEYDGSGVDGSGLVEAEIKPKHPLEDYKITEKDVGSLVWYSPQSDFGDFPNYDILSTAHSKDSYQRWQPVLDTVKLFFRPFYATEDSVAPDDLGEHYAVLWSDGRISALSETWGELWTKDEDQPYAVGYRPLKFVNPLEEV